MLTKLHLELYTEYLKDIKKNGRKVLLKNFGSFFVWPLKYLKT